MRTIVKNAVKARRLWMFRLHEVQYITNGHLVLTVQPGDKTARALKKNGLPERGNYELTPDGIQKIGEHQRNILSKYLELDGTTAEQAETTELIRQTYHGEIEVYTSEHYAFGLNRDYAKEIGTPMYYHHDKRFVRAYNGGCMVARLGELERLMQHIITKKAIT